MSRGFWISLVLATAAQGATPAMLPDSFHLVYKSTTAGTGSISTIDVSFDHGKARLEISYPQRGGLRRIVKDPWVANDVRELWEEVEAADMVRFKPVPGPAVPDFGRVEMSVQYAKAGKNFQSGSLLWEAPLKNDGQIWKLRDHLDRISLQVSTSSDSGAVRPRPSPIDSRPSPGSAAGEPRSTR